MTDYNDYRRWLTPTERSYMGSEWWIENGAPDPIMVEKAKDRAARAEKLCGGPVVCRYWGEGGWFVTPDPHASPPKWVGDRDFRRFVSDDGSCDGIDL